MDTKFITIPVKSSTKVNVEATEADYWVLRRKLRRVQRETTKMWWMFILMSCIAAICLIVVGVAIVKLNSIFGEIAKFAS